MKEKESFAYFPYDRESYKKMKTLLENWHTSKHYYAFTKVSLTDGLGNSFKTKKLKGFYYMDEEMYPYEKLQDFFASFKMIYIYYCGETKMITVYDKGKVVFEFLEQDGIVVDNLNQLANDKVKAEMD